MGNLAPPSLGDDCAVLCHSCVNISLRVQCTAPPENDADPCCSKLQGLGRHKRGDAKGTSSQRMIPTHVSNEAAREIAGRRQIFATASRKSACHRRLIVNGLALRFGFVQT